MAIRTVPGAYVTIQAAIDASSPGDTIVIASSYRGPKLADVPIDNLTFEAPADVTGIELNLPDSVFQVTLNGSAPINVRYGESGQSVIGNAGDNVIKDGSFSWFEGKVSGGDGADRIFAYSGIDHLSGDAGDDYFVLYNDGGTVDGGIGTDTVITNSLTGYSFRNVEVLDLNGGGLSAELPQLSLFKTIEVGDSAAQDSRVQFHLSGKGGAFDFSTLIGGDHSVQTWAEIVESALRLTGTAQADVLRGSRHRDILDGGDGADWIGDDWGGDTLRGAGGDDTFVLPGRSFRQYDDGSVDGGEGQDTVESSGVLLNYIFRNVETLAADHIEGTIKQIASFSKIVDNIKFLSEAGKLTVDLNGAGGSIDFSTRLKDGRSIELDASQVTSAVSVTGTAKNDLIEGTAYSDTFKGGTGSDIFVVQNASDRVIEIAGAGSDTIRAAVSYKLAAKQSVESLATADAAGTTAINLTGNELNNAITGNAGANILDGGLGRDVLTGLAGKDTFAFRTALGPSNVDRIVGFSDKDDTVQLENGIFKALGEGKLSASAFKDITLASTKIDADDHILYNHNTGVLYYDADGSGKAGRVIFAVLDSHPNISASDFFVV